MVKRRVVDNTEDWVRSERLLSQREHGVYATPCKQWRVKTNNVNNEEEKDRVGDWANVREV